MTQPNAADDTGDDQITMAKLAYTAYSQAVGGKAFNGDQLPAYEGTPSTIQAAWVSAVNAVVSYLQGGPPAADDLAPID